MFMHDTCIYLFVSNVCIPRVQVSRKEKELECVKRAPAEAESRKVMILAEAQKTKTLALAGAEAAAIKVGVPTVNFCILLCNFCDTLKVNGQ